MTESRGLSPAGAPLTNPRIALQEHFSKSPKGRKIRALKYFSVQSLLASTMRVVRLHLPRPGSADPGSAYINASYDINPANVFKHQLEELAEAIWKPFSLELYATDSMVYATMAGDDDIIDFLITGLYSWASDLELHDIEDYTYNVSSNTLVAGADFRLWRPDIYWLATIANFKTDSMAPVVAALSQVPEGERFLVQYIVEPVRFGLRHNLSILKTRITDKFQAIFRTRRYFKKDLATETQKRVLEKCGKRLFRTNVRLTAFADLPLHSKVPRRQVQEGLEKTLNMVATAVKNYNSIEDNKLILKSIDRSRSWIKLVQHRGFVKPFRITSDELTTFWHPPSAAFMPNTSQILSKRAPAPRALPTNLEDPEVCAFGVTNYRDQESVFGIKRFDRRRHLYVVGKSGGGKSCLLQLLVRNDIEKGFGCAVLDPHGDLVDDILRLIPKHRVQDVVLFDPSDPKFAPSFNPMDPIRPELRLRVALSFLDAFKRSFGADWSERMDHVLRYAMLGLLSVPGSNILSLRRMLSDDDFRTEVVRKASDESVKRFWLREFAARRQDFEEGPISRLLNRLDELLATETMRNVLGQTSNLFNFREFMDNRKIVLLKISKGVLGSENATLLGSLLIWKIFEAAMSRADIPSENREDFFFYVDEFQNFATDSFAEILSESRKYKLCLTFANQFLGQLPANVRKTVFGNISSLLSFRVGADDADIISSELKPYFGSDDVINLPLRDFYLKMSVDGQVQDSFSGRTLDLVYPPAEENLAEECIAHSRSKYCIAVDPSRKQAPKKGPQAGNAG